MSVIVIQLGQCGNQVGMSFFDALAEEARIEEEVKVMAAAAMSTATADDSGALENDSHNNNMNRNRTINGGGDTKSNTAAMPKSQPQMRKANSFARQKPLPRIHSGSGRPAMGLDDSSYSCSIRDTFFRRRLIKGTKALSSHPDAVYVARAVLVDTEAKVLNKIKLRKRAGWCFSPDNMHVQKSRSGSANNWAFGYHVHGPECFEAVRKRVKAEVEKCGSFGGFLILQSLAGGTGSGLGSYFTEMLRKEYPEAAIVNQVVLPYDSGEVIVQNYNSLLTLSTLHQWSDAVILFHNDHVQKICHDRLALKQVTYTDLNKVIAHCLINLFLPCRRLQARRSKLSGGKIETKYSEFLVFHEIVAHLCPLPHFKFLSVQFLPQMSQAALAYSTHNWQPILRRLLLSSISRDASEDQNLDWSSPHICKAISTLLFLRGNNTIKSKAETEEQLLSKLATAVLLPAVTLPASGNIGSLTEGLFSDSRLYADWSDDPVHLCVSDRPYGGFDKSAFLVSNSQSVIKHLDQMLDKACMMFENNAYVHQYYKYKLKPEDFHNAFITIQQAIDNYKNL